METDAFLATFFGDENTLTLEAALARPWLNDFITDLKAWPAHPVVLPHVLSGGVVTWYVMAPGPDDYRRVDEEAYAFIGPTFSRWDGRLDPAEASGPVA